ncbi:MAG: FAD-dependent oxidoreductase [Bacteroidales bacterium]|nr:FAD-dependent oxidoreductase [Bacteroidales bacterium]
MKKLFVALLSFAVSFYAFAEDDTYDLVVYGGNSSGVVAAYTAARCGLDVVLVEATGHIGGLTASGIGHIDIGWPQTVGGYAGEFLHRAARHYGRNGIAIDVECSVAEKIFLEMLSEADVEVLYNARLAQADAVVKDDGKITSVTLEDGRVLSAKMFVDASYEGDLMAQAGVLYVVGREPADLYGETSAGVQRYRTLRALTPGQIDTVRMLRRRFPLDVIPSGKYEEGTADGKTQAYVYRLCVTDNPDNMVPFCKPANYDANRYFNVLYRIRRRNATTLRQVLTLYPLPGGKYDLNHMDLINASWNYPEGSYSTRAMIEQYHKDYQQGYLYFLANDPRVPEVLRKDVQRYGLAKDEFADNGNWPYQIYIREARRMVGQYVMTQYDAWDYWQKEDAVAVGSYFLDCHMVSSILTPEGRIEEEGLFENTPYRPYQIPYRSITPKKEQCTNLLVTSCISASHVIFASLRMEPVYMMLGQAAASAAALAIDGDAAVQDVNIGQLQTLLKRHGQIIQYAPPANMFLRQTDYDGIVLDDTNAEIQGYWGHSTAQGPFMKYDYIFAEGNKNGTASVTYNPFIETKGKYEVFIMYAPGTNRSRNVPVKVIDRKGAHTVYVDQTVSPEDGLWHSLGVFEFDPEKEHKVIVSNRTEHGIVVADGVRVKKAVAAEKKPDFINYPMPEGEKPSLLFSLEAKGENVGVYETKVSPSDRQARLKGMDDKKNSHEFFEMAAFAYFDISAPVEVKVSALGRKIESVKVLPSSAGVKAKITGGKAVLTVTPGQKLTVEINGDEYRSLHIFANEIEENVPDKNSGDVIYFGPGIHKVGRVVVRDNQTLYVAGGAVLMCDTSDKPEGPYHPSITVAGNNAKVRGCGIIDGSLCPNLSRNLLYVNGTDISVEGVVLRDASVWTVPVQRSENVHIDGIKILGYRANSDGIDICNSKNVLVENCFIRTLDDLIVVKTLRNGGECKDVVVRKNVLWNEVAHGLSIGAEINHDISNVVFSDCDIIHDKGREWSLRIYHCDGAVVSNVLFKDIRIEESRNFISLWINKAVWSSGERRGHIKGVRFSDIKASGVMNPAIDIQGYDAEHIVEDVRFDNVVADGKNALDNIRTNEYVKKIN